MRAALPLLIAVMAFVVPTSANAAFPQPTNDACATPTVVMTLPFSDDVDTRGATIEGNDPSSDCSCTLSGQDVGSVWYRFTPPANATISVDSIGSDFDTVLNVYTGTCGSLTTTECSDDYAASSAQDRIIFDAVGGTTYLIEATGCNVTGQLHITIDAAPTKDLGKATDKCQQTVKKAGATFLGKALKSGSKCVNALFKCVQLKQETFNECRAKACGSCIKELTKITGLSEKLNAKVTGKCNATLVPFTRVQNTSGLGYDNVTAGCSPAASDLTSLIGCVDSQHLCQLGVLAGAEVPRARELIGLCGIVPTQLECLPVHGSGSNLGDESAQKSVVKCQGKVEKAATKFVLKKLKSLEKCADAVFTCVQTKPDQSDCIVDAGSKGKAGKTCAKQLAKIEAAAAQLPPAIEKACSEVDQGDLFSVNGANVQSLVDECSSFGVTLTNLATYAECVLRQHQCVAEDLLLFEAPTAAGLFRLVDRELKSDFCPVVM